MPRVGQLLPLPPVHDAPLFQLQVPPPQFDVNTVPGSDPKPLVIADAPAHHASVIAAISVMEIRGLIYGVFVYIK